VKALAVASEPYIFWKGDGAKAVIDQIRPPAGVGTLVPADEKFNGPSGIALDDHVLTHLGLHRNSTQPRQHTGYVRPATAQP
jgi:hypothetical protein